MALKSAQMAGLTVSSQAMDGDHRWLKAAGNGAGQFAYDARRRRQLGDERRGPALHAVSGRQAQRSRASPAAWPT